MKLVPAETPARTLEVTVHGFLGYFGRSDTNMNTNKMAPFTLLHFRNILEIGGDSLIPKIP